MSARDGGGEVSPASPNRGGLKFFGSAIARASEVCAQAHTHTLFASLRAPVLRSSACLGIYILASRVCAVITAICIRYSSPFSPRRRLTARRLPRSPPLAAESPARARLQRPRLPQEVCIQLILACARYARRAATAVPRFLVTNGASPRRLLAQARTTSTPGARGCAAPETCSAGMCAAISCARAQAAVVLAL